MTEYSISRTMYIRLTDLCKQDQRNPLVVCDVALHGACLSWHHVRFREVVRIGHPADAVGEFDVGVCEVGRRPAVDRRADILRGADNHSEDHEENDSVAVVQPVGKVVVVSGVRLDDPRHSIEDALEHHRCVVGRLHQRRFQHRQPYSF